MKITKKILLFFSFLPLFSSCMHPEWYEDEIEDQVKLIIVIENFGNDNLLSALAYEYASALIQLGGYQDPLLQLYDDVHNYVIEENDIWETTPYKKALEVFASNRNYELQKLAKDVLKKYNNTNVRLSNFIEANPFPYSVYNFKELNTGTEFSFAMDDDGNIIVKSGYFE